MSSIFEQRLLVGYSILYTEKLLRKRARGEAVFLTDAESTETSGEFAAYAAGELLPSREIPAEWGDTCRREYRILAYRRSERLAAIRRR